MSQASAGRTNLRPFSDTPFHYERSRELPGGGQKQRRELGYSSTTFRFSPSAFYPISRSFANLVLIARCTPSSSPLLALPPVCGHFPFCYDSMG